MNTLSSITSIRRAAVELVLVCGGFFALVHDASTKPTGEAILLAFVGYYLRAAHEEARKDVP